MTETKVAKVKFYNVLEDIIIIFYMIGVCDIFTTFITYEQMNVIEGNPIAALILEHTGFLGLLIAKILFCVILYFIAEEVIKSGRLYLWNICVKVLFTLGLVIVINNLICAGKGLGVI